VVRAQSLFHFAARRFRVLDECDEMLNMGFVDDVEKVRRPSMRVAAGDGRGAP